MAGVTDAAGKTSAAVEVELETETRDEPAAVVEALQAENLQKSYRGRCVVNNVSITVRPGEVVGLLGPNGAGKTTTFYMIVGLETPDAGRILLGVRNHASADVSPGAPWSELPSPGTVNLPQADG